MTKYFFDTEFLDNGKTIDLISIGIVCEDGRELYLQNLDCNFFKADDWVKENVLTKLDGFTKELTPELSVLERINFKGDKWHSKQEIAKQVQEFITGDNIELWGEYCAYDFVALCQLWGKAIDKPSNIPWLAKDIQQFITDKAILPALPTNENPHNALDDAKHIFNKYKFITEFKRLGITQ